jgi:hypothetical protein
LGLRTKNADAQRPVKAPATPLPGHRR